MPEIIDSDNYEIQEEIAQGSMGKVCKALDRKLNRIVAVKVVHQHLASDESFRKRFLREARAMAQLQHPNIVTIHDVVQHEGPPFIVMEYFPGSTLQTRMEPGTSFPLTDALAITNQLANALAYAHEHGIIHRDIKPANVLIGPDNLVKLTDFGIAAAIDEAPLTTAGQLIGTLRYMSPEQARDATLDGRSDLYSLGLILYEMLTGTHPRRNLSNTAILGILTAEANAPLLAFPPSVPVDIQTIVKDLLRYQPGDRIRDAHELHRRLESLPGIGRKLLPPSHTKTSPSADETICELQTPGIAPPPKTPPNHPDDPPRKFSILPILIILAIVASGVGLYALSTTIKSLFSAQPPILPPLSDSKSIPVPPTPTVTPGKAEPPSTPPLAALPQVQPQQKTAPPPHRPGAMSAPIQGKQEPTPTPVSPARAPTQVPLLVKPDQRAMDLLEQLRRSVTEKNLVALNEISVMSKDRRLTLEALFTNYSAIEASIGEIASNSTGVTTVLRIDKLVLPNGDSVPPGSTLRKIRIAIPREGDGWGQVLW